MRILVCGGRDFNDRELLYITLSEYLKENLTIIEGGAKGADEMALNWAIDFNIPVETYCADWKRFGKKAGPLRNQRMLDEGLPDLVIAFPGGHGTADMVKRARKSGIPVKEINYDVDFQSLYT